jgi:hypothetical protein
MTPLKCRLCLNYGFQKLQGGPRAARRAVQLLVKLGRSTNACELFLQHRAAILNAALK